MLSDEGMSPEPNALKAAGGSYGAAARFVDEDLGPLARILDGLLTAGDATFAGRTELARVIGARAARPRIEAVFELAQAVTAQRARQCEDNLSRQAFIDAHAKLVALVGQTPTHNFDAGLLSLEIGTLLVTAHAASEPAHG